MGLKPASEGVAVIACNTCRFSPAARDGGDRRAEGARLVEALRRVHSSDPAYAAIAVEEMACLFACHESCTVHIRGPGKVGYVLGRFAPDEDAARAILEYARAYARSAWGEVPFREWPEGVRGHFITRTPPPGALVE